MSVLEIADASGSDADGASTIQLKPGRPDGVTPSGRQSRARGATPRELADTFAKLLGGGSVLLAMWLEVEEAAMTPAEADAIAEPLARIINRAAWGKLIAKRLIGADDYIALSVALFSYGVRIYPLLAAKASENAQSRRTAPPIRQKPTESAQHAAESNGAGAGDARNGVRFDPGAFSTFVAD